MKQLLLLFALLLGSLPICAQQVMWERTYGTSTTEIGKCALLPDGGFALLLRDGMSLSVSRLDSAGNQVWNQPLGSNDFIITNCILKAVPGGIMVGVMHHVAQTDTMLPQLIKLNWQGAELWRKQLYTGRTYNQLSDLHIRSANEYLLLAAGHNPSQGGGAKFIVFSIDSAGVVNWRKNYFEDSLGYGVPRNIINYRQNGYLFCGQMGFNGAFPYIMKTDEAGNFLQHVLIDDVPNPGNYATFINNFIPVSDKSIAFTGYNSESSIPDRFILVSKADTALNTLWTVTHAEPGVGLESSRIAEMADSSILMVTQKQNNNKLILVKISPGGQLLDTVYITTSNPTHIFTAR